MTAKFEVVSVKRFCQLFYGSVPADSLPSAPHVSKDLFEGIEKVRNIESIRSLFCKIVNDNNIIPGFRIAEYDNTYHLDALNTSGHAGVFKATDIPGARRPHHWRQCMPVEFKFDVDIFGSQDSNSAVALCGELTHYAGLIMWLQHRTHLFMPLVFGQHARMLYWDRSGVVATEPFSYVEHPGHLCDLLYGFSQLSEAEQGLDPTVTLVTKDMPEYDEMSKQADLKKFPLDIGVHPGTVLPAGTNIDTAIFRYERQMFAQSIKRDGVEFEGRTIPSSAIWPRWKVTVPDPLRGERQYLVGLPFFVATGVIGRATRCYVGWDMIDKCFVMLKDAWRTLYAQMDREGTILEILNFMGVHNIPTVLRHADLPGQETRCPSIWKECRDAEANAAATKPVEAIEKPVEGPVEGPAEAPPSPSVTADTVKPALSGKRQSTASASRPSAASSLPTPSTGTKRPREEEDSEPEAEHGVEYAAFRDKDGCPFRKHQHYRMVVKEIGIPLKAIQTLKQLVEVIADCTIAHKDAFSLTDLMHRDLSIGNVLIHPRIVAGENGAPPWVCWFGLLTDWEVAKSIYVKEARQPERTATWQFVSVACMEDPLKDVEVPDELESLFNILLRIAIERGVSNCDKVPTFIERFFDEFDPFDGAPERRQQAMRNGHLRSGKKVVLKFCPALAAHPLNYIISVLLPVFKARYTVYDYSCANTTAPPLSPAPPPALSPEASFAPYTARPPRAEAGVDELLLDIPEESTPEPTSKEKQLAQRLEDHDFFYNVLMTAIDTRPWPTDDVREGEISLDDYVPLAADGERPSKRQKSERQRKELSKGHRIKSPYGSYSIPK